jgi:alpha-tubulin suppressor-like RCC1 family protein
MNSKLGWQAFKRVTNFTNNNNSNNKGNISEVLDLLEIKNKMYYNLFSFDYIIRKLDVFLPKELKYLIMRAIYDLLIWVPNVSDSSGMISMVKTTCGVYVCGGNGDGQLGLDCKERKKNTFSKISINIVSICSGNNYTIALSDEGKLFLSGGHYKIQKFKKKFSEVKNIVAISSGFAHVIALDQDGRIFGMGDNGDGQLAIRTKGINPFSLIYLENIIKISCGSYHSFALDKNGVLFGTGSNAFGQLGLSDNYSRNTFTIVNSEKIGTILAISCGGFHTILLNNNGDVFSVGRNSSGQLALGDYKSSRNTFHKININKIVSVACGHLNTLALNENGNIFACGNNGFGQLGLGDYRNRNKFSKIRIGNIISIGCGHNHMVVLNKDGDIYSCGQNVFGQLGNGNYDNCVSTLARVNNIKSL